MRSSFGNGIDQAYGSLTVNYNGGAAAGGGLNVSAAAGLNGALEAAGNGGTIGVNSLFVGVSAGGVAQVFARGAQQLQLGVNAGNQINISSAGDVSVPNVLGSATSSVLYTGAPVTNFGSSNPTINLLSANTTFRSTAATLTITIPANASIALPIGTMLTFINSGGGVMTIAITTDTMTLANSATTGSRSLASNGLATAIKMTATTWLISGNGLT